MRGQAFDSGTAEHRKQPSQLSCDPPTGPCRRRPSRPTCREAFSWIAALIAVSLFVVLTALHSGDSRGWTAFSDGGELLAASLAHARLLDAGGQGAPATRSDGAGAASGHRSSPIAGLERHAQVAWTLLGRRDGGVGLR